MKMVETLCVPPLQICTTTLLHRKLASPDPEGGLFGFGFVRLSKIQMTHLLSFPITGTKMTLAHDRTLHSVQAPQQTGQTPQVKSQCLESKGPTEELFRIPYELAMVNRSSSSNYLVEHWRNQLYGLMGVDPSPWPPRDERLWASCNALC